MTCGPILSGELPTPFGCLVLGSGPQVLVSSRSSLERAMVNYLTSVPAVSCLIGNRYYPHQVPRENTTWPAVTYYRSSTEHHHLLAGSAGWAMADVALDVWSPSYADTYTTAETLRMALQGFSGWWGCVQIGGIWLDGEDDTGPEKPGDGSGTWWYSRSLDFRIAFAEPAPQF